MAISSNTANSISHVVVMIVLSTTLSSPSSAQQLSVSFYANTCPSVFDTVREATRSVINRDARMGASLLRLFFHDCFVNGCDGGILLEDTGSFVGEQSAPGNAGLRGFGVINNMKAQIDRTCGSGVVSCADILAIAARDSVVELGGPSYLVPVGRRDARTASIAGARSDLPAFFHNLDTLLEIFQRKGFNAREMVALSGAHTIGQSRCAAFRDRIYNQTNIDPSFATSRQATCPRTVGNGDGNLAPLDPQSPNRFGNNYFQALLNRRGLLNSDQVLFNGGETDSFVRMYSENANAFSVDFGNAMVKMGNLGPLISTQGEIRVNCARLN